MKGLSLYRRITSVVTIRSRNSLWLPGGSVDI